MRLRLDIIMPHTTAIINRPCEEQCYYRSMKMDPTHLSEDTDYQSYTHEPLNSHVQDDKPPCKIWIESMPDAYTTEPQALHKVPQIKVYKPFILYMLIALWHSEHIKL